MSATKAGRVLPSRAHFISGLPRAGSTLLSAILRQNPRFQARVSSPVALLWATLQRNMSGGEFGVFFDDARRASILRQVFDGYYHDTQAGQVIFDTNRTWTGRVPLLGQIYPQSRIICCVREVAWIIDSLERMLAKNPLQLSSIFKYQPGSSVYARVEGLMNSEKGMIGLAWSTLREAWFSDLAKRLILIRYESLAKTPHIVIERLYHELGEVPFAHDFSKVAYDEPEYDAQIGLPGLHKVRAKVEFEERKPTIPPDLFAKYAPTSFWNEPKLNPRGVLVL